MQKQKNNPKGITLIALVVTVIVLIILAGVSIAMVVGDNGIITQAQRAVQETEQKKKEETNTLEKIEDSMNDYLMGIKIEQVTDSNPGKLEGNGTETNPYVINSIEDLLCFANQVKNGETYSQQYVELGISLDFDSEKSYGNIEKKYLYDKQKMEYRETEGEGKSLKEFLMNELGWMPIGNVIDSTESFEGTFDGKGYVIKNLRINNQIDKVSHWGLFAYNSGCIKNITLLNVDIDIQGLENTYIFVGSICGINLGNIDNVKTFGKIYYSGNYGVVGGISRSKSKPRK